MAQNPPDIKPLTAEVLSVKGECTAGHKVGDKLSLSCWDTGGLCGFFYHDIFPSISLMLFGGQYPWAEGDELTVECPDRENAVAIRLRRS